MPHLSDPEVAQFALRLRDKMKLRHLIESGTHTGISTLWAAKHFEHVDTVDINEGFIHQAMERCDGRENIIFRFGDVRAILPNLVVRLTAPALFWLDAHNRAGLFGPTEDDCPIIEELTAALYSPHRHAVLIDDAMDFESSDGNGAYPKLSRIKQMARDAGYLCGVGANVIVIVPHVLSKELQEFCHSAEARMEGIREAYNKARRKFSLNLGWPASWGIRGTAENR